MESDLRSVSSCSSIASTYTFRQRLNSNESLEKIAAENLATCLFGFEPDTPEEDYYRRHPVRLGRNDSDVASSANDSLDYMTIDGGEDNDDDDDNDIVENDNEINTDLQDENKSHAYRTVDVIQDEDNDCDHGEVHRILQSSVILETDKDGSRGIEKENKLNKKNGLDKNKSFIVNNDPCSPVVTTIQVKSCTTEDIQDVTNKKSEDFLDDDSSLNEGRGSIESTTIPALHAETKNDIIEVGNFISNERTVSESNSLVDNATQHSKNLAGHVPGIENNNEKNGESTAPSDAEGSSALETPTASNLTASSTFVEPKISKRTKGRRWKKTATKTTNERKKTKRSSSISCGSASCNDDDDEHGSVFRRWNNYRRVQPQHVIDLKQLRKIVTSGIVEEGSHRAVAWRVLFGYLPIETSNWDAVLKEKRKLYIELVHRLFRNVEDVEDGSPLRGNRNRQSILIERRRSMTNSSGSDNDDDLIENDEEFLDRRNRSRVYSNDSIDLEIDFTIEGSPTFGSNGGGAGTSGPSMIRRSSLSSLQKHSQVQVIPKVLHDFWKKNNKDIRVLERLLNDRMNVLRIDIDSFQGEDDEVVQQSDAGDNENLTRQMETINGPHDSIVTNDNNNHNIDQAESRLRDIFESVYLLDEIHKDVVRTNPDLAFFLEPALQIGKRRYAAIERILFVWSKYNKGVKYVQGMNEIVGILYYVLANDVNDEWSTFAEPDTYWLLHSLLAEMQDVFVPDLDHSVTGIQGRIQAMEALLARHDPEVKEHLDDLKLEVSFFAIRWWTTLLSREFVLPDTIRLWDSMFASTHKDNYLRYVCVTMIMYIRDTLLKGDFGVCLRLLQAYPSTHTDQLLESSRALWLYESQITVACHRGGISLHQALTTIESPPALIMAFGLKNGKPPTVTSTVASYFDSINTNNNSINATSASLGRAAMVQAERAKVQAERAKAQAEVSVVKAKTSARGMFGRAFGFYQRYTQDLKNKQNNSTTGNNSSKPQENKNNDNDVKAKDVTGVSAIAPEASDNSVKGLLLADNEEDIYLKAILNAS